MFVSIDGNFININNITYICKSGKSIKINFNNDNHLLVKGELNVIATLIKNGENNE